MFHKIITLLLLIMAMQPVAAQPDFVVLPKGDTLYGAVSFISYGKEYRIQFTGADQKKILFTIVQVKAFCKDGRHHHTVRTDQGYQVLQVLKEGYLSLYAYRLENQITWDGRYLMKKDGQGMEVPNLLFKKIMKKFLSDCPDIVGELENGTLTRNDLNTIIDRYNACLQASPSVAVNKVAPHNEWDDLEKKVAALAEGDDKTRALEIIMEIKLKLQRAEKVPAFMITSLRTSLAAYPDLAAQAEPLLKSLE